jgi:hypothetical protein
MSIPYGYRVYGSYNKLLSWSDRHCFICGKFLNKRQHKYCKLHGSSKELDKRRNLTKKRKLLHYLHNLKYMKSSKEYKLYHKTYSFVRNNIEKLNIGDIF